MSCSFVEGKSTGRSEVVSSVMDSSESEAEVSVLSVIPVSVFSVVPVSVLFVSVFADSVFSLVSVFSAFVGKDSEGEAGKSTMRDHDKWHERAR